MDHVIAAGLVDPQSAVTFAHNQLVVILPSDNPGQMEALADLARPGLKLILAGEQVPAGAYARQVLQNLSADSAYGGNYLTAVLSNVVSNEENVKQVIAKVQLGEADAGIVYRTDLLPGLQDTLQQIEIPEEVNVRADYFMAALAGAAEPELAGQFEQFVLGPEGQRILEKWGFIGSGR